MNTWARAPRERKCGKCGRPIYVEQPMCTITGAPGTTFRLVRCSDCAGEAAPDLPPTPPRVVRELAIATTKPRSPWQSVAQMLPLDWKTRSTGDV